MNKVDRKSLVEILEETVNRIYEMEEGLNFITSSEEVYNEGKKKELFLELKKEYDRLSKFCEFFKDKN